ncbi:alpha/beta fold hydrolase [Pacificimonas sp. WHA3]|uniref:Alpha/beta fold hydrolase n=1 Tax=Pacificimonas pallii TaxID=2827236 RepID=A0ABS6SG90_9SPHN|nr:alpha/beta fold hydrolase [Pacificimonas pallii]MBV7257361.1 alpha/beta fold hydrolase [Pacificimonas pallii]
MPRSDSNAADANSLARKNAAQQYGQAERGRGPHPLPLFWQLVHAEVKDDAARRARVMAAVRRYQDAPRAAPMPPPDVVAEDGGTRLLSYGGGEGRAVVFIPSLVNPPDILDLDEERSMMRWFAARGRRVYLIDWGTPAAAERAYDLADYVLRIERLLAGLGRPVVAGYCLGGTLAMAVAARGGAAALATIAAPWDFSGYTDERRDGLAAFWQRTKPIAVPLGSVPMNMLQPAFWSLDPGAPVRKFEHYAAMAADDAEARRFEAMEDWANGGAPLTLPALADTFEGLFGGNKTGHGEWRICDVPVTQDAIKVPWVNFISSTDRIVPAAAAPRSPDDRHVACGHVGMVAGSRARPLLWEPLDQWIRSL